MQSWRSMARIGLLTCGLLTFAETAAPTFKVIQDRGSSVTVEFQLNGYDLIPENINGRIYSRIALPGAVSLLEKGFPDLPTVCRNIIVSDEGVMDYRIVEADFEIRKIDPVAPSKGNLYRNVDPKTIPYEFDKFYEGNGWWPARTDELSDPFILRDYRGVSIRINPFQFNPATNELKVTKRLGVEVFKAAAGGLNVIKTPKSGVTREFAGT